MTDDDLTYFQRRAEAEVERAEKAVSPAVVAAHYKLATAYLERVAALRGGGVPAHG